MKTAAGRIKKVYYGLPMLSTDSALPTDSLKSHGYVQNGGHRSEQGCGAPGP